MKTKIFLFAIFVLCNLCAFSQRKQRDNQQSEESSTTSLPFDTVMAFQHVRLSMADSLSLHYDNSDTTRNSYNINEMRLISVNPKLPCFYIYTVTNILAERESDVGHYCSFVILYAREDSLSHVHRIYQDSIEVITGSLSGFMPSYQFADVNHDGYKDIIVSFTGNTVDRIGCNYFFVFNVNTLTFKPEPTLFNLFHDQEISIEEYAKQISTGGRMGLSDFYTAQYRWNGKTYELFAEESTEEIGGGSATVDMRKELVNGEWKVVKSDTTYYK